MDKLIIKGGVPLCGTIKISGSKNAALPILLAALLTEGRCEFLNVPQLRDIDTTLKLLNILGVSCSFAEGRVLASSNGHINPEAPYDLVKTMRASALCLGPLLARLGQAKVALPGGCAIGARPVNLHLSALEKMGATFELDSGYVNGRTKGLVGAKIVFEFPTVGGTENLLMAASLAKGETILENAAREPEVVDLANFLIACGAKIEGHGTGVIHIQGVESLTGQTYKIMPDRIEAGTYMIAAAITRGHLTLKNCPCEELTSVVDKLKEMGVCFNEELSGSGTLEIFTNGPTICVDVATMPYPGFPTDMQAQIMALMCVSQGAGTIRETIFENRFMHVQELVRLGAHIFPTGNAALVRGTEKLIGAPVMASDLRASASLVLAGLRATGTTVMQRVYHLDRGYEQMEVKLSRVGAQIERQHG